MTDNTSLLPLIQRFFEKDLRISNECSAELSTFRSTIESLVFTCLARKESTGISFRCWLCHVVLSVFKLWVIIFIRMRRL
jgi:hypothetical protein